MDGGNGSGGGDDGNGAGGGERSERSGVVLINDQGGYSIYANPEDVLEL